MSAIEEAVSSSAASAEGDVLFPLKGKKVDDVAPRMRFAPSPTGRYVHLSGIIGDACYVLSWTLLSRIIWCVTLMHGRNVFIGMPMRIIPKISKRTPTSFFAS